MGDDICKTYIQWIANIQNIWLALEQHRFELHRSTFPWSVFNQYILQSYTIGSCLNLQMGNCGCEGLTINYMPIYNRMDWYLTLSCLRVNFIKNSYNSITKNNWMKKMGRGSKQTFFQRRHPNGQWAYKKMLSIINYQGNANQNHSKILPYTSYNGYDQKDKKQVLAKMWRKRSPRALLVGM